MPVFSTLAPARHALGLESIYEGYLLHYGRPRLFAPADSDTAILLLPFSPCRCTCAAWAGTAALLGSIDVRLETGRAALRLQADPAPLQAVAELEAGSEAVARALALHAERVH